MESVKFSSPGTFGTKQQKIELFLAPKSKRLIIFFHGCCGGPYDFSPTIYQETAPLIAEKGIANTAFFQSSRQVEKHLLPPEEVADYESFVTKAFGGKTLLNEKDDADMALQEIIQQLKAQNIFYDELFFVGFSLGGVIATLLSSLYSPKKISLFGSALQFTVPAYLPIIGNGMETDELLVQAKAFPHKIHIFRGGEDTTSTQEASLDLFKSFENAEEKSYTEWQGVDHRFKQFFGKDNHEIWTRIMNEIIASVDEKSV